MTARWVAFESPDAPGMGISTLIGVGNLEPMGPLDPHLIELEITVPIHAIGLGTVDAIVGRSNAIAIDTIGGTAMLLIADAPVLSAGEINASAHFNASDITCPESDYILGINISGVTPVASFTGTPTSGDPPLSVTFTDTSTGSPTSWLWEKSDDGVTWVPFDGTPTVQNPTEDFDAGTWSVRLTATNANGSDTATETDYIDVVSDPPVADFSADVVTGSAPLTVTFTDLSTNSPTGWFWEKNDGSGWVPFDGTPTVQNPVEDFDEGTWDVRLTAVNGGGFDQEEKTDYITVTAAGHRYWQLTRWSVFDTANMGMSEIQLIAAGVNVTALATKTSTTAPVAGALANLFDGNLATDAYFTDDEVRGFSGPWAIKFDFGGSPQAITGLKFGAFNQPNRWPWAVELQYSDDDVTYTPYGHADHEMLPYPGASTLSPEITPVPFVEITDGAQWSQNIANKTTGVTVSGGGKIATKSALTYEAIRTTVNFKAGDDFRAYFEIRWIDVDASDHIGFMDWWSTITSGVNWSFTPGWAGYGYDYSGGRYNSLYSAVAPVFVGNFVNNDILGVYVDAIFGMIWFHRNGTWLNYSGNWDPPAGRSFQGQSMPENLESFANFYDNNNVGPSVVELLTNAADLVYPLLAPLGSTRGLGANPAADNHRYWRINGFTTTNGELEISEIQFLVDGVDVNALMTKSTSTVPSTGTTAQLFDGNLATEAGFIAANVPGLYVMAGFAVTPADWQQVNGIKFGGFTDSTKYPLGFTLQYSDDGAVTWHTVASVTGLVYPGNNTMSAEIPVPTPSTPVACQALLVGGGGAGGSTAAGLTEVGCGGGGGGGIQDFPAMMMVPGSYPVVIGDGGVFAGTYGGDNGDATTFNGESAAGGGGGGGQNGSVVGHIWGGCSGGQAGGYVGGPSQFTLPAGQGFAGGAGPAAPDIGGGGGGGGSAVGADGAATTGGDGGDGYTSSITGSAVVYAGGGGGGIRGGTGTVGLGGTGGGGDAGASSGGNGVAGTANLGGGGGGGSINAGVCFGANGGKGVFIFRYPTASFDHTGGDATGTDGSDTWVQFNSSGTLVLT